MTTIEELAQLVFKLERRLDDLVAPELAADPVGGTATTGQVAYWTSAVTIGGDAGLTYDAATDTLGIGNQIRRTTDTDTYIQWPAADWLRIVVGGTTMLDIAEAATDYVNIVQGLLFLNETSNGNMAQGITVDQGANDDEILNFRSSDVGAVYNLVETTTFFTITKAEGVAGGALMNAFKDADGANNGALQLAGFLAENVDTTKTSAGRAIVEIGGYETDGTDVINTVANGNVFSVMTYRGGAVVTLLLLDEDADMNLPGGRIATGFGDYWDLEDYTGGTVTDTGYVRVDINGTTYQLLARLPP